jgi:hypothetical protein
MDYHQREKYHMLLGNCAWSDRPRQTVGKRRLPEVLLPKASPCLNARFRRLECLRSRSGVEFLVLGCGGGIGYASVSMTASSTHD